MYKLKMKKVVEFFIKTDCSQSCFFVHKNSLKIKEVIIGVFLLLNGPSSKDRRFAEESRNW